MYTAGKVVEVLKNIGVTPEQIGQWERYFGIPVPHDTQGKKYYNDSHIKFFKNVKKYLALGYKLSDIKSRLNAEIPAPSPPVKKSPDPKTTKPLNKPIINNANLKTPDKGTLHLIMLVERLMDEKNQLLTERDYLLEQIHVLEMQKQQISKASLEYIDQLSEKEEKIASLEKDMETTIASVSAEAFTGSWSGRAKLIKVVFDSIEADIPRERTKSFKVTDPPKRLYHNMAVFMSSFQNSDDPYWERTETYRLAFNNNHELTGELDVEYFVDDVCVAKAIYSILCTKK